MIKSSKDLISKGIQTEINLLRLPLYKCSSKSQQKDKIFLSEKIEDKQVDITIDNGYKIGTFHRKIVLAIEYLYKRQNPDYEMSEVITNYTELASILNYSSTATNDLWNALEELRDVKITTKISKRIPKKNTSKKKEQFELQVTEEIFNLFPRIRQNKTFDENGKPIYTNSILIELNSWHVQNFKNKYFRLINANITMTLKSALAIRLFDYFVYKGYYKNKYGKYVQKKKLTAIYNELVQFCRATPQKQIKEIRRQFSRPFKELQDKGILLDCDIHRGGNNEVLLTFYLADKFQWTEELVVNTEFLTEEEKNNPIISKCIDYGITSGQMRALLNNKDINNDLMAEKVKQLEFLMKHDPSKTENPGKFLYVSIVGDWKFPEYFKYIKRKEKAKISRDKSLSTAEKVELEESYYKYTRKLCDEYWNGLKQEDKEHMLKHLQEKIESPFLNDKSMHSLMLEVKKTEHLCAILKVKSIDDFAVEMGSKQQELF